MECNVRDLKIYYESIGEGTPILMIHGWSPDHRLMKGCMEPVFKTGDTAWKRIYFDLPGMGKTKGAPWIDGSDRMLELVLDFIDIVIPNQHFLLAGESYGGYIARGIIKKRPSVVDGLLLICPSVDQEVKEKGAEFRVLEEDASFMDGLPEGDKIYFTGKGLNTVRNRRVWERFRDEILPGLKLADYSFLENCLGQNVPYSFNVDALEKPFVKPSLFLAGRQDSAVGYRDLWKIIGMYPRASFVLLDKAAHNLQIEQDVLFTAAVGEWLERVAAELERVAVGR
ncbi:MAG TPA: alpha/beta hydrolase [Clostridia bacterium]|nr:alpha/beta hydrolase [Clostridia bacterium]